MMGVPLAANKRHAVFQPHHLCVVSRHYRYRLCWVGPFPGSILQKMAHQQTLLHAQAPLVQQHRIHSQGGPCFLYVVEHST